jgi:Ca-activated chloride channel family protein
MSSSIKHTLTPGLANVPKRPVLPPDATRVAEGSENPSRTRRSACRPPAPPALWAYAVHHRVPPLTRGIIVLVCLLSLLTACAGPTAPQTTASQTPQPAQKTPPAPSCTSRSSNPVSLTMYYGSEKESWLNNVIATFNKGGYRACDGPITVNAKAMGSGDSMQRILAGEKPDIWSPAGRIWLQLLNDTWQRKYNRAIIAPGAADTPPLVNSPVVIAMWKPQAEALGWPGKSIGWSDIAKLSTSPRGWADYGHPEFGNFKFGHTHPEYSNSGLDAVIAEHYAATGKQRSLTKDDVTNPKTQDFVANVESSVIHYGESTLFFAQKMFRNGPSYLSAAVMYENVVVEANDSKTYPQLKYPVAAIYPREGTFYSDHPFAVLQGDWVTPAKKTSAQVFRDFLLGAEQQRKALQYGFRPSSLKIALTAPLDMQHGVDPKQPQSLLTIPSTEVVNAIKASWKQQKRKVDVMLVLDRSGSMNATSDGTSRIEAAKQGAIDFIKLLGDSDGLGLTIFSTEANVISPTSSLGPKRQALIGTVSNIVAGGNTRLYNTIDEQVQALQTHATKQRIKAVVVLTDGEDTTRQMTAEQLIQRIKPAGNDVNAGESVKVFTIAYGDLSLVDEQSLQRIAEVTGGKEYLGTPQNIRQIYQQISQFF